MLSYCNRSTRFHVLYSTVNDRVSNDQKYDRVIQVWDHADTCENLHKNSLQVLIHKRSERIPFLDPSCCCWTLSSIVLWYSGDTLNTLVNKLCKRLQIKSTHKAVPSPDPFQRSWSFLSESFYWIQELDNDFVVQKKMEKVGCLKINLPLADPSAEKTRQISNRTKPAFWRLKTEHQTLNGF